MGRRQEVVLLHSVVVVVDGWRVKVKVKVGGIERNRLFLVVFNQEEENCRGEEEEGDRDTDREERRVKVVTLGRVRGKRREMRENRKYAGRMSKC